MEEEIEQAEDAQNIEKANLLKKIKHFYEMKMQLDSEHEKDNIELMIAGIRKQINELDAHRQPREGEFDVEERDQQYRNPEYSDSDNYYGQPGEMKERQKNDRQDYNPAEKYPVSHYKT